MNTGPNDQLPTTTRRTKVPGRNERCPCGSGKKAKHCCLKKIKALAALPVRVRREMVVRSILRDWPTVAMTPGPQGPGQVIQIDGGKITLDGGIVIPVESGEVAVMAPGVTAAGVTAADTTA